MAAGVGFEPTLWRINNPLGYQLPDPATLGSAFAAAEVRGRRPLANPHEIRLQLGRLAELRDRRVRARDRLVVPGRMDLAMAVAAEVCDGAEAVALVLLARAGHEMVLRGAGIAPAELAGHRVSVLAEGAGFEPARPSRALAFSKRAPAADRDDPSVAPLPGFAPGRARLMRPPHCWLC